MRLFNFGNLSSLSKLSLFVVLLLVVAIFTTISFSLRQQSLVGKAWSTNESATAQCSDKGEAEIAVRFSNLESLNSSIPVNISVKDVQTGLMVDMGTVYPSKTGTALIKTHRKEIDGSSVIFFLSGTNNSSDIAQRGAVYTQVSCKPTPTSAPTSTFKKVHTPTPEVVRSTYLKIDVVFHGIGAGADKKSLKGRANQDPTHKARTVTVDVLNERHDLVMSKTGDLTYASDSGHFLGTIDMGRNLKTGAYLVKVKADQYLKTLLPVIESIKSGKINVIGEVDLIAGDLNNDNAISIFDYNLLIGCYSDLRPAVACVGDSLKTAADLTDDGTVNQYDYSLFLRELNNRGGVGKS